LISQDNIILLSPLGYSPTGQIYNVLFEEVANVTASKLNADKLIFVHDNDDLPLLPRQLNMKQLSALKTTYEDRIFQEISNALQAGVERAHVVDMDIRGGLLLELYTRDGIGSMFSSGLYDEPRDAVIDDVGGILDLIRPLEAVGTLKKRSREQLELEIGNFSVIERDGKIIGCAALYLIEETDAAELACLAVHEDYRTGKRGVDLVSHITDRARALGVKSLIILTTQSIDWFRERGFKLETIDALPGSRKSLYNVQRNSKVMVKVIN
jgi:amino-acid N-acetyltransferase